MTESHDPADLQAEVYATHSTEYDRLVSAEDVDGNLAPAILGDADASGLTVVEAGAGTGRITRLLEGRGAFVAASDLSHAMLATASGRGSRVLLGADAAALPVRSGVADLAVAGWVFAHFRLWMPDGWRETASAAVGELRRVTTPSGRIVVVESLGTGVSEPGPPTPELAEFHDWLTDDCGLTCHTIATDYVFDSPAEARELTAAFFGAEFAATLADDQVRIPEFTGVWTS